MKINLEHVQKCDQVWDEMTPCQGGRLCQKCTKIIIDFRNLSDREIAETHMFSKEPVCGIYREDQLKIEKPITRIKKYSKIKMNAIWLGLLGLIYTNDIKANTSHKTQTVQLDTNRNLNNSHLKPSVTQDSIPIKDKIIIHGLLKYEGDEVLIGGAVYVKDSKIGTVSDVEGFYQLDITEAIDTVEQITLVYQYTGFKTYERLFKKGDTLEINIQFDEIEPVESLNMTFFGVSKSRKVEETKVEEEPTKKTFFQKVKSIFKRKSKKENN